MDMIVVEHCPKPLMSAAMTIYARAIRNPRLLLIAGLLAVGLMLPILAAIS